MLRFAAMNDGFNRPTEQGTKFGPLKWIVPLVLAIGAIGLLSDKQPRPPVPGNVAANSPLAPPTPQIGIQILSQRASVTGSYGKIQGQIKNVTSDELPYLKIVATIYDASGQCLQTAYCYPTFDPLQPGQTSPFQLPFYWDLYT